MQCPRQAHPAQPDCPLGSPEGNPAAKILGAVLDHGLHTGLEVRAVKKWWAKIEQQLVSGAHAVIQERPHQALGNPVGFGRSIGQLFGQSHGFRLQ